ncbi:hypothetical protein G7Y79_00028g062540 [Physcia stellaris]|nr:hypothetical protein G7Y79_00028g062540 [Physcia stellaris]
MRRNDPRLRQTLNQISQNIESANISTQASLYTFSQNYVSPCLASLSTCLEASCQPCFACLPHRDSQRHPHRSTRRGRDDLGFDFYDDWDEEEGNWGNDELDRLLAGSNEQPGRRAGMSYGTGIAKRKSKGIPRDGGLDPNVVPKSSMFGFLERLPWKIGGRSVRYRPSAADLQENVGKGVREAEPLMEESEESVTSMRRGRHGRNRSGTTNSRSTTNSLSSRGDLFPSEDEDDAVPLDDEFAMVLARRSTGTTSDDHSSKKSKRRRPGTSPLSTKTASSRDTRRNRKEAPIPSPGSGKIPSIIESASDGETSMADLKQEEEQIREEEEAEIESKRQSAQRLALERGLGNPEEQQGVS